MTIRLAFGTSTPTSITVVATSTCSSPAANAAIVEDFSSAIRRPWTRPTFKPGSALEVEIDKRKFLLFTHEDRAYARDAAADHALMGAMKNGKAMLARGVSARGTATLDRYSLAGFSSAHQSLDKACP